MSTVPPTGSVAAAAPVPLDDGPGPTRLELLVRAFSHRNYRLFFGGQIVSLIGTFLTQVATIWLVYRLTHQTRLLGAVGFAGQIPMFLLAPFAGVWVDRLNRQRLLVLTQTLAMFQSLALALLAYKWGDAPRLAVPGIMILAVIQGLINAFDLPARQAFLVELVTDRADLANAIALNSTMVHGARLIGPAVAGLLIYSVGESLCFLLDGLSYIAVIAALLAMTIQPRQLRPRRSVWHELHEGFRYVWCFKPVRVLLIVMAVLSLTGMPAFSILMPVYGDFFGGPRRGSQVLGILMASSGLGALVGALYLASRPTVVGLGKVIMYAASLFGLSLIAFSFSRRLPTSLLIVPVAGWASMTSFAAANTILQTLVDDDKRGRVMSFFTMAFVGMTPFGNLLAGELAERLGRGAAPTLRAVVGASRTLRVEGLICLAAGATFAYVLPSMRKIVRPIYVKKGIMPDEVATGIESATAVVSSAEA